MLRLRGGEGTPPRDIGVPSLNEPLIFVQDEDVLGLATSDTLMWPGRLNGWHSYMTSGTLDHVRNAICDRLVRPDRLERLIVVDIPVVRDLVSQVTFLTRSQLQEIARLHHMRLTRHMTKPQMVSAFATHECTPSCDGRYVLFSTLPRERFSGELPFALHTMPSLPDRPQAQVAPVLQTVFSSGRANASVEYNTGDALCPDAEFPEFCSEESRLGIIAEFQDAMDPRHHIYDACAVCGQKKKPCDLSVVNAEELDLTILRNDDLPAHLWPSSYDFRLYDRAILSPHGMHDTESLSDLSVCRSCSLSIERGVQPRDALANWQYYAIERLPEDVRIAFEQSTVHERQIIAACRATTVSYIIEQHRGGDPDAPQRYCKNNVAIIPQDIGRLNRLLPPDPDEVPYTMCVLFVGGSAPPTVETIRDMKPLLVSKTRVATMLRFLVENNPYYREAGMQFSQRNLDTMCSGRLFPPNADTGVPLTADVQFFPRGSEAARSVNVGYDTGVGEPWIPDDEVFTEVAGFTDVVADSGGHNSLKARALRWCLDHRPFVAMRGGSTLFPDRDPRMLTFVFPHLDPWGIGGFNHPSRGHASVLSMEAQVRNLLMAYNSPFERDPNFPYVCWNAIQKLETSRSIQFKTHEKNLERLSHELVEYKDIIKDMSEKWSVNPAREPVTRGERRVASLLAKLKVVAKDLRGSNGRRVALRNQIRGLLKTYGCPALFITLNPADIHHKLMHILSGRSEATFGETSSFSRKKNVADHPASAAVFFDTMINAFIKHILRYGRDEAGVFGTCQAYFGTVEAQGRGTLHCHMLIWLKGNLNPQALRDRMERDDLFKQTLFTWLESIIKCELPGMVPSIGDETSGPWIRPRVDADMCTTDAPILPDNLNPENRSLFQENFKHFVQDMAIACNWHEHTETCWKYLNNNEPRDDAHCRMRIDGRTRSFTELDPETSSILLRRLHPWINNYNDLVIFLMKCNMDVKYIGSGQAAKALVYYVTDYVTKGSLPLHTGLQALMWAIQHNEAKYAGQDDVDQRSVGKSLMIKVVNAMMGRQELSHQQVMSYLVGGGDHYTSHKFRTLYWPDFDRYIRREFREDSDEDEYGVSVMPVEEDDISSGEVPSGLNIYADDLDELAIDEPNINGIDSGDDVVFKVEGPNVKRSSLLVDYRLRSELGVFNTMPLWDFVAVTRLELVKTAERVFNPQLARGRLYSREHPAYETHVNRLRDARVVPVLIGSQFPKINSDDPSEKERWYRMMLILFKPWRFPQDLRGSGLTWKDAWEAYTFPPHLVHIMNNMNIEQECKDARAVYDQERRAGVVAPLIDGPRGLSGFADNNELLQYALAHDEGLNYELLKGHLDEDISMGPSRSVAREFRVRETLDVLQRTGVFRPSTQPVPEYVDDVYEDSAVEGHKKLMDAYAKNKRPSTGKKKSEGQRTPAYGPHLPSTYLDFLRAGREVLPDSIPVEGEDAEAAHKRASEAVINSVIHDLEMTGNREQASALRVVGNHLLSKTSEQLLMYIAGVGGTGKSHVVKAIVELFGRCGADSRLLLSAPTGIASVLIGGYTIHALTMLPASKRRRIRMDVLTEIWKSVDYLIVDEVSMISALFLAQMSERLSLARGWKGDKSKMFGGINLIFLGDFGQLKPVHDSALYAHELVSELKSNVHHSIKGQTALYGAYLWRQVTLVIKLQKNMRHASDTEYGELLERVRQGQARVKPGVNGQLSDYDTLAKRQLNVLHDSATRGEFDLDRFRDCPIIVADKELRDAINLAVAKTKARSLGVDLHYYAAVDKRDSRVLDVALREKLLCLKSTHTSDGLGMLPLFKGMKVMFTENIDISHRTVNGSEGTVREVKYSVDKDGYRVADCVYVHVPGSCAKIPGIPEEVVPVFPRRFKVEYVISKDKKVTLSRYQVPLLPAYAYTDYKSQGRSLDTVIVDLSGARSVQGLYVMLSRVKTLDGLAILRWFPPSKIGKGLSHALRDEFERLDSLADETMRKFDR